MIIALLAVLGVDLIVIVVLLLFMLGRKRWVRRQPGIFQGAIRVRGGTIEGFRPTWMRGYGRWVRDVLVWTKSPFLFRNELIAIDALGTGRPAATGEVKRLGRDVTVTAMSAGTATVEVASSNDDIPQVLGSDHRF